MNKEALINSLDRINDAKVAVIGDIALDKYTYGKIERVNPENPRVPLLKVYSEEFRLGCAANVASNLISLGAKAELYGIIGLDSYGKTIEELCNKNCLNHWLIYRGKTIVKERCNESEFDEYLLRKDYGEENLVGLDNNSAEEFYNIIKDKDLDAIVLSDYNKVMFKNGFGKILVELANSKNIPVIVDPKPNNALSFMGSTLFRPNIKEAREITGYKDEVELNVTRKLFEIVRSKYVVVTCGKNGAVCYDGKEFTEIPTKAREKIDVTGAGDTACAGLTIGLLAGLSLVESAYLANYAAGIVVEKKGTSVVYRDELIERIRTDA